MPARSLAVFAFALLTGCGGEARETPAPADEAAPAAATEPAAEPAEPVVADPDLEAMVADIRTGLAELPERVAEDPAGARQATIQLYVTRQEEIEHRWGPNGSEEPSPALAGAVDAAETRFHHLMELLAATPRPDPAAVADAVAELDAAQAAVLAVAR